MTGTGPPASRLTDDDRQLIASSGSGGLPCAPAPATSTG